MRPIFLPVLIVLVFFMLAQKTSNAQIGFKIAQSKPLGDFGAAFKKAPTYEFIYHVKAYEGLILSKVSLSYTNFKTRQDTIPVYMVGLQNGYRVYPGKLAYQNMSYISFSIDNQIRIFKTHGFEFFGGLGLGITQAHYAYYLNYETQLRETSDKNDYVACANVSVLGLYNMNEHFAVFADLQYQYATFTDWSVQFPNRQIGFGLLYTIKPEDDEE